MKKEAQYELILGLRLVSGTYITSGPTNTIADEQLFLKEYIRIGV